MFRINEKESGRIFKAHDAPCPDGNFRDMGDEAYLPVFSPEHKTRIQSINSTILPYYEKANKASNDAQKLHKRFSKITIFSVIAAAIFGIIQVSKIYQSELLLLIETVAIVLAVGSWIIDVLLGCHNRWIIERHKAERYRFLKFRQVIDPLHADTFRDECQAIEDIHSDTCLKRFSRWISVANQENGLVSNWTEAAGLSIDDYSFKPGAPDTQFWELVRYYICVRLRYQISYYEGKSRQNAGLAILHKFVGPCLFFIIALMTIAHVFYDWGGDYSVEAAASVAHYEFGIGFILIFIAALLFVIHSGLKIMKGIFAFPLIQKVYHSTGKALSRCNDELVQYLKKAVSGEIKPGEKEYIKSVDRSLMLLYNCEEIMQREHAFWFAIISQTEMV